MKMYTMTREFWDLYTTYTDMGMSEKEAELRAKADIMQAMGR